MILDALLSEADLQDFLKLPTQVYQGDAHFLPESVVKTRASLLRETFIDRQKVYIVRRAGQVVARVVARVSPSLQHSDGSPIGMLGFFEAFDSNEEVSELLSHANDWLVQQGVRMIVGPMDGDTWHRYRFNVGPFDQPPFLLEPYNKSYYGRLWQDAGFTPLENYYSKVVEDAEAAATALAKIHRRVLDRGFRLRPIELSRFEAEMSIIYQLSTEIFANNFLYEPISLEDFLALYRPAQSLIDPKLVLIAESPEGEPAGFVFSIVDYQRAVSAMRGGSGLLAKLRFLLNRHRANAVNIKSLGVVAKHRHSGLAAALMCQSYRTGLQMGYRRANMCLIRDGNPSGRLDGEVGKISRRYILYRYAAEST